MSCGKRETTETFPKQVSSQSHLPPIGINGDDLKDVFKKGKHGHKRAKEDGCLECAQLAGMNRKSKSKSGH